MSNKCIVRNLMCSIDYLAFTVKKYNNPVTVATELGMDLIKFSNYNRGANGYRKMYKEKLSGITILYDGTNSDMGVHVSCTGRAVPYLLDYYMEHLQEETPWGPAYDYGVYDNVVPCLLDWISANGQISRIDFAIDDYGGNYYSVEDIYENLEQQKVATKFRTYSYNMTRSIAGERVGATVYLGNRKSNIFVRIYDKQLEQNAKLSVDKRSDVPWIRYEMELKDEHAVRAAAQLVTHYENGMPASGITIGELSMGILSHYVRLIERDNNNISRCSTQDTWQAFVDDVKKIRLTVQRFPKTLDEVKAWISRQCIPSIAAVSACEYGDMSFIMDKLQDGLIHCNPHLLNLVYQNNPDILQEIFD